MLMQVCLLLLSIGVYTSYAGSSEPATADPLFSELGIFPENFNSRFPNESEFFTVKIFMYLFFNLFAKHFGEKEPIKFWTKFNHNDFNRVAIDAAFYEYLTKFADRKMKNSIYNPLASSASSPEEFAIDRIGEYLDSLSTAEVPVDRPETLKQTAKDCKQRFAKCSMAPVPTPIIGFPGKDFPNYCDIPKTSFTCSDKLVPGIYADVETRCQVFHACWPHRLDSFLCPIGTTFNQALLTCDFWHESDCSSSPLLFNPPFQATTPTNAESTTVVYDEASTTTESTSSTTESVIPEYDGTCQSLLSKPLQQHIKFLPAKCKVTNFNQTTPETTSESSICDEKRFDPLLVDILSGPFKEMFKSIIKAAEFGVAKQLAEKEPKLKMESPTKKLHSRVKSTGSTAKNSNAHTINERIHYSTIDIPSDNQDKSRVDFRVVEKSTFKSASQGKVEHGHSVRRSTLLTSSKPSEDKIKQVFETMTKSLELGGKVVNEGVLPLVEKVVLDSHRKKTQS